MKHKPTTEVLAKKAALASARTFLRGRNPRTALAGLSLDLRALLARHFRQVEREEEDWKYSRSVERHTPSFTLEISHDSTAYLDAIGHDVPVTVHVSGHSELDPHSEDCLGLVADVLACRASILDPRKTRPLD